MGSAVSCCKKKQANSDRQKVAHVGSGRAFISGPDSQFHNKITIGQEPNMERQFSLDENDLENRAGSQFVMIKKSKILNSDKLPNINDQAKIKLNARKEESVKKEEKCEEKEKVNLTANFLFSMTFANFYKAPIIERQKEESSNYEDSSSNRVSSDAKNDELKSIIKQSKQRRDSKEKYYEFKNARSHAQGSKKGTYPALFEDEIKKQDYSNKVQFSPRKRGDQTITLNSDNND